MTVKAYDVLPYTSFEFAYNATANSDTFWTMSAYFHAELPRLVKSGIMGYFWVIPSEPTEQNTTTMQGRLYGEWLAPKLTLREVQSHLAPIEEYFKSGHLQDKVTISGYGKERKDYTKEFAAVNDPDTAGIPVRLGSRLLDEQALSRPLSEIKNALRKASGDAWPILGHVIAGPGTWEPKGGIAGGSNAVLHAWRKTVMQIGSYQHVKACLPTLTSL